MVKSNTHKIGFYIRVSTEEQAENPEGSIKNQEERLRAMVTMKNLDGNWGEVAGVFIDRGKSGKDMNRPELQRLLNSIRAKEITFVMVSDLSRLTRSIRDFSGIKELMDDFGCGFYSLRESFDSTTAAGEMVMYTMANMAQFERKQVSERVTANMRARASRGLYNGGVLPIGYKLIPEKPGYLAIDEDQAEAVRQAFATYLLEGTLTKAAKALNRQGVKIQRKTQGGGNKPRLGHFTVPNLRDVLRNKAYIAVRRFHTGKEWKEAPAVWDPIIDVETFNQAQELLKKGKVRKPGIQGRYPFLLTGLTFCDACKAHLNGRSANGNGGRFPYYEHGWAMVAQGCKENRIFNCPHRRVSGRRLEESIWANIERLLSDPKNSEDIAAEAKRIHAEKSSSAEIAKHRAKIRYIESQLEALAERLSELPKSISAAPIYQQMEKLEKQRAGEGERILALQTSGGGYEMPVGLTTYRGYLAALNKLKQNPVAKAQIIEELVHRIDITPDGYRVHYYAGENHVERGLARRAGPRPGLSLISGSRELTNGGPTKNRTWNKALGKLRYIHLTMGPQKAAPNF